MHFNLFITLADCPVKLKQVQIHAADSLYLSQGGKGTPATQHFPFHHQVCANSRTNCDTQQLPSGHRSCPASAAAESAAAVETVWESTRLLLAGGAVGSLACCEFHG